MIRTPARFTKYLTALTPGISCFTTRQLVRVFSFTLLLTLMAQANAQWENFASENSELAQLLQNLNGGQALLYEALENMGSDSGSERARNSLQRQLDMEANMSMQDMMAQGHDMAGMDMVEAGPFDGLETPVQVDIHEFLTSNDSAENMSRLEQAIGNIRNVSPRVRTIIDHGAHFRASIYEIYADDGLRNKNLAVAEAMQEYLQDSTVSVPDVPKDASLALEHRHAKAFARAYPKLSTLIWSGTWIELATIETLMLEHRNPDLSDAVDIALERFNGKLSAASEVHMASMNMNTAIPTERPTAPAIAPQLYNAHPEVAIILDNLSMFEAVVMDILAYPNLTDRLGLIETAADEFTNVEINISENLDYLVSALRGGIYDQGGPASGDLSQSERNRSRGNMEMEHDTPKPSSTMRID